MPGYHAILSCSGAERWMKCTPSARFEQQFADTDSIYAREGTLVHKIAELLTKRKLGRIPKKEFTTKMALCMAQDVYQPEMKACADNFATYCIEKMNGYGPTAHMNTECEIDTSDFIEEGSGTLDNSIVFENILDITDLKFGKGVPVDAEMNPQLLCYALGAYKKFSLLFDIDIIRMTVYQPRIDNITSSEISVAKLMAWGETSLRPAAEKAWKGEGEYLVGDHCRFCKGRPQCREFRNNVNELAKQVFDGIAVEGVKEALTDPNKMDLEETAAILLKYKLVESWFKAVNEYALDQAVNHRIKFPGMKLVEGRSNRIINKPEKVLEALHSAGYTDDLVLTPRELFGITKLTEQMGSEDFNRIVDPFLIKPKGSPTLVSLKDKKPELNSAIEAAEVFAKIDLETLDID